MSVAEGPFCGISAVDLFCGVGGLTHGLIKGGITVGAGIDVDPACKFPFESNNSARVLQKDVKEISASEVSLYFTPNSFSMLAGCAPCQPFSTYSRGKRSQKKDQDWQLLREFGRLVREIQPDLVTMENVAQLAGHTVFQEFIAALEGYHTSWSVIECSTLGVPQSRKRLVLLASKLGPAGLDTPSNLGETPTVRKTISGLPAIRAGESDPGDPLHTASSLSSLNMKRIMASKPGGTWRDWDPSLRTTCHTRDSGVSYPSVYGRMEWDKVAPTITTQCFGYGNGRFGHPEQNRAISLREAAMLQTFPRNYRFIADGEKVLFSRLGRLIGNAVPVRLGEVIAEVLKRHVEMVAGLSTDQRDHEVGLGSRDRVYPHSHLTRNEETRTCDHGDKCGQLLPDLSAARDSATNRAPARPMRTAVRESSRTDPSPYDWPLYVARGGASAPRRTCGRSHQPLGPST
jgi:DNA (cytosine-5)-methyltransferase 1